MEGKKMNQLVVRKLEPVEKRLKSLEGKIDSIPYKWVYFGIYIAIGDYYVSRNKIEGRRSY